MPEMFEQKQKIDICTSVEMSHAVYLRKQRKTKIICKE